MDILNQIANDVYTNERLHDSLVEAAIELIDSDIISESRLGITESVDSSQYVPGIVTLKKGDLVLDPQDQTVYVATGEYQDDKAMIINARTKKAVDRELLIVGAASSNPAIKKAAQSLALKYPNRKVYVHGELPRKGTGSTVILPKLQTQPV